MPKAAPTGARAALERLLAQGVAMPRGSARSSAARSTCCSAAGRSTIRPPSSPWTWWRGCSRPTTSIRGGANPLRDDPGRQRRFRPRWRAAPIKLFVTATNVRTGRGRVFRNAEITPDVLLASACLPTMFQAVEIDGEAYWDGGYSGNPTITPLVRECDSQRHHPGADQSGRAPGHAALGARDPQPAERGLVQRGAAQGAAHDRAAAPGRRSRQRRGGRLGRHAHPPRRRAA